MAWTGLAAFFFGLLISAMLARVLPFGWDGQVAAFIMNADRWDAGSALMKAQSPEAWNVLMAAGRLTADNSAALGACRDAAAKSKLSTSCSKTVTRSDGNCARKPAASSFTTKRQVPCNRFRITAPSSS